MNKVILIGRLTKDVELRKTTQGTSVVSFTIAVNRRSKEDGADFINCVAWNKTAELISTYLRKGSQCAIDGRIQTRNYEKDNNRVYVTEVVCDSIEFLGSASGASNKEATYEQNMGYQSDNSFDDSNFDGGSFDPSSDDLPF